MADLFRRTNVNATALADTRNKLKAQIGAGSAFHLDAAEVSVTAANGDGTLATALALLAQIMVVYQTGGGSWPGHVNDALALKAVDATNVTATPTPTDLASAITRANDVKAKYNAHCASTAAHFNADATNTVGTADATDQASLDTLLNAIKTKLNAHIGAAGAPAGVAPSLRVIPA